MAKRLKIAALVALLFFVSWAGHLVWIAGELKTIAPHFDGTCRFVEGVPGPEDIVILPDGSGALIASNDRLAARRGEVPRGAIYFYDLTVANATPVDVTPPMTTPFFPHGIGLYKSQTLFVVNHPIEGSAAAEPQHTIEVFDIVGHTLTLRRTISDPLLFAPNDVAPVSPDSFYVSNDHGSGSELMAKVEDYGRLKRAHLLFFDGGEFARLPGEYRYANGVMTSRDDATLYLAAPTDRTVYIFDRDATTNALTLRREVFTDTGVDNITLDENGDLWIASHPKMLHFALYRAGLIERSPSEVIVLRRDRDFAIEQIFLSDGDDLSTSTVAAPIGKRLLIGAVYSDGFLDCTRH